MPEAARPGAAPAHGRRSPEAGPRAISAVLFDFAGTLLVPLSPRDWVAAAGAPAALAEAFGTAGLPGGPYPDTVPDAIADAYERRDLSPDAHRHAYTELARTVSAEHAEAVYEQVAEPQTWVPYPDALDVVAELERRGIRTGVVSNAGFDIRRILRHHGFTALADRTTVSYEVGVMKPDPAIFRAALGMLGTSAEETLMVGDNADADGGATAVGMDFLLLPMSPPGARHGLAAVLTRLRGPAPGAAAAGEPS